MLPLCKWPYFTSLQHAYKTTGRVATSSGALESPEGLERLLIEFGGQVTDAIGHEIDQLEEQLAEAVPESQHVDLEPD